MAVDGGAGGLDHEHVGSAHVFLNVQVDFAVGELFDVGGGERAAEFIADLSGPEPGSSCPRTL